jgi:hypothetical protein
MRIKQCGSHFSYLKSFMEGVDAVLALQIHLDSQLCSVAGEKASALS